MGRLGWPARAAPPEPGPGSTNSDKNGSKTLPTRSHGRPWPEVGLSLPSSYKACLTPSRTRRHRRRQLRPPESLSKLTRSNAGCSGLPILAFKLGGTVAASRLPVSLVSTITGSLRPRAVPRPSPNPATHSRGPPAAGPPAGISGPATWEQTVTRGKKEHSFATCSASSSVACHNGLSFVMTFTCQPYL